jgi:hypothetical protein
LFNATKKLAMAALGFGALYSIIVTLMRLFFDTVAVGEESHTVTPGGGHTVATSRGHDTAATDRGYDTASTSQGYDAACTGQDHDTVELVEGADRGYG